MALRVAGSCVAGRNAEEPPANQFRNDGLADTMSETETEALKRILRQQRNRERVASECMTLAARLSVKSQFGWSAPDCVTLTEAARLLRGEPEPVTPEIVEGVMSANQ